jgi:hypothetical protein
MSLSGEPRFRKTRQGAPAHPYTVAGIATLSGLVGLAAATQFVADGFAYHPDLGPPLYAPASPGACAAAQILRGTTAW